MPKPKTLKPLPVYKETTSNLKEGLRRIRHLLSKGWCVDYLGKTAQGQPVQGDHAEAVQVCAIGAIHRANLTRTLERIIRHRAEVKLPAGAITIVEFNNAQASVTPVLALFK